MQFNKHVILSNFEILFQIFFYSNRISKIDMLTIFPQNLYQELSSKLSTNMLQ